MSQSSASPPSVARSAPAATEQAESERVEPFVVPDLLHLVPRPGFDAEGVQELLELSFLGREAADDLDAVLGAESGGWDLDSFAHDLFVRDLIREQFAVVAGGMRFPPREQFLFQVLSAPPVDAAEVRFRQAILRELEDDEDLAERAHDLYREVFRLLDMFKAPDHAAQLDLDAHRLDIFRQAKTVIDRMAGDFGAARSGLARLGEAGAAMQATRQYRRLADLLEHEGRAATVTVDVAVGADGEVKSLTLHAIREHRENPFHTPPWRRWLLRLRSALLGQRLDRKVILRRILREVFHEVSPSLVPLVQVLGHLEVYLASCAFRQRMATLGLDTCLPEVVPEAPVEAERLFNPLLAAVGTAPVPCDVVQESPRLTTLVTGPNSGGKTRLLQSLGLAQLLGQSGLWAPAARARLPLVRGLFVSLVEQETAAQAEGRLGREMLRIRRLFERTGSPSMVILDELCSGTNPSEGVEIFDLVLRLLERLGAVAFVSTHFLEHARHLRDARPVARLDFLRVATDDDLRSTYQFVDGVAETSLAAETARRLGVTFDDLAALIDRRDST
ncbi:MAG: DNA mismatch repair protein [Acidobacteriota bacterium]